MKQTKHFHSLDHIWNSAPWNSWNWKLCFLCHFFSNQVCTVCECWLHGQDQIRTAFRDFNTYLREMLKWLICVSNNFNCGYFSEAIDFFDVRSLTPCMMIIISIKPNAFIPVSVTLIRFQGHISGKKDKTETCLLLSFYPIEFKLCMLVTDTTWSWWECF